MKLTTTALGIVLALSSVPATAQLTRSMESKDTKETPAPEGKAAGLKPSNGAMKAIVDLQNAVNANDVANIPAKVAAAQAVATTKEDHYLIGVFQRKAALAAKDNVTLATAVQAIEASGYPDAPTTAALYADLGVQQFNAKQFPGAVASFKRATTLSPNDLSLLQLLADSQAAAGQKAESVAVYQRIMQASASSGQKPSEDVLRRAVQAAYDAQSPSAIDLGRQWVANYPSTDSWRNSVIIYRNMNHPDVEGTLDLLRLLQLAGALSTPSEYSLFASAAADQQNFVEAQSVIDAGIAAGKVNPADPLFRDTVVGLKAKPKLTAADLVEAEKASTTSVALVRVGDRYYGMGQYAKAADLYRKALAKGGGDAPVTNLHLGMALARAGDKPGATAALKAVTGPREGIAQYWLLYLQTHA